MEKARIENAGKEIDVFSVALGDGNPLIVTTLQQVLYTIEMECDQMIAGDELDFTIKLKKMSKEEFSELPEHEGW